MADGTDDPASSSERYYFGVLLALVASVAVAHQLWWSGWLIEDAAISFAYTKHLVAGEGLVPWSGSERVEGYSNFTWVLLLAPLHWLGWPGFVSAKPVAALLTVLTVPLVWGIAREAEPARRLPALAAVLAFAAHAQVAHWYASGLENALFGFLLALGIWRMVLEFRTGAWPWSALAFCALSATRPEAILYGATAGALAMVSHRVAGRGMGPMWRWLVTFFVPFGAYHAWRFNYFAYELPQTYYAKLGTRHPKPWLWSGTGWNYVRNWAHINWHGYLLPIYLLALTGGRGRGVGAVIGASFTAGFVVFFGANLRGLVPVMVVSIFAMFYAAYRSGGERIQNRWLIPTLILVGVGAASVEISLALGVAVPDPPVPSWWGETPSYVLISIGALAPVMTLGRPGWRPRLLCWSLSAIGIFFAIYAQGDWMRNFRWMSLPAVPMCVLFGLGAAAFADLVEDLFDDRRMWGAGLVVAMGVFVGPNLAQTARVGRDIGPLLVKERVDYKHGVLRRLRHRGAVVDLDVDMGAHMFWSGFESHDIAGLVDIPFAQHHFRRPFVQEYVFEQMRPHFAHVHATWAKTSGIPSYDPWKANYVELPGYRTPSGRMHGGNFIRRDMLFDTSWPTTDRRAAFRGGVVLEGWTIQSPEVAAGRRVVLEVGLRARSRRVADDFQLIAFLTSNGRVATSWNLAPGHGWVLPHDWRRKEVFHGRYALFLPEDLPLGSYDLGFVVLDSEGVVPVVPPRPGGGVMAKGEVQYAMAVQVVPLEERAVAARSDRMVALAEAAEGRCEEAELAWFRSLDHRPDEAAYLASFGRKVQGALATCWALSAADVSDAEAVEHLVRARRLDPSVGELRDIGGPIADRLTREGRAALDDADWDTAFSKLDGAVQIDPMRSWARRYAEQARHERIEIKAEERRRRKEQKSVRTTSGDE